MQYQYIVSAQKSSAVTSSTSGHFTNPNDTNLLVAKGNRLELFTQQPTSDKLKLVGEYPFNGNISDLIFFHPKDRPTGLVFVLSAGKPNRFAVVSWDPSEHRLVTESSGEIIEYTGRPAMERKLVAVDPDCRFIAIYAYQGIVHILPMVGTENRRVRLGDLPYMVDDSSLVNGLLVPDYLLSESGDESAKNKKKKGKGKAAEHTIRSSDLFVARTGYIHELKVIDMQILPSQGSDTAGQLVVLFEDASMTRQIHIYSVPVSVNSLADGNKWKPKSEWISESSESNANMVVPLRGGSVMVIEDEGLTVESSEGRQVGLSKRAASVNAWAWIGQGRERLLMADDMGTLWLVVVRYQNEKVVELIAERLGDIPATTTTLATLQGGQVFVGAHGGEHSVVRLHTQPVDSELLVDDWEHKVKTVAKSSGLLADPLGKSIEVSEDLGSSFVEPLETMDNLAPVVDLCMINLEDQKSHGHGIVVACSGSHSRPGLRAIRNGIGIKKIAGVEMGGVRDVWSMAVNTEDGKQIVMVLSTVGGTSIAGWNEGMGDSMMEASELHELDAPGWCTTEPTLVAGLVNSYQQQQEFAVQVTGSGIRLIAADQGRWSQKVAEWAPSKIIGCNTISAAAVEDQQVVVVLDGDKLCYVEVVINFGQPALVQRAVVELDNSVSCLDIHSWPDQRGQPKTTHVAVGLWGSSDVLLFSAPDLLPVSLSEPLTLTDNSSLPRSVLLCTIGNIDYLLVGMGDGVLHHFVLQIDNQVSVAEHRAVPLGSQPLKLVSFCNPNGTLSMLAASDHPAVLFADSASSRLRIAAVDASLIHCAAPLDSTAISDSLVLASDTELWIGRTDPTQRLHIKCRVLPNRIQPHRIAYNQRSSVFGVAAIHRLDSTATIDACWNNDIRCRTKLSGTMQYCPVEVGTISVMSGEGSRGSTPRDVLATMVLAPYEMPESMCVASRLDVGDNYLEDVFVMGTSVVMSNEDDARLGRVMVGEWDGGKNKLRMVAQVQVKGAAYALEPFRGMILAGVGNRLLLLGLQKRGTTPPEEDTLGMGICDNVELVPSPDYELVVISSQQTQIAALTVAIRGDLIVVGDLMSSVSLYKFERNEEGHRFLVPLMRDPAGVWMTAVASVQQPLSQNEPHLLPAPLPEEVTSAMPSYERAFSTTHQTERFVGADADCNLFRISIASEKKLAIEARWHLGDMVNVMRAGSLVMDITDAEFPNAFRPQLVYGTLNGAVGVIVSVEQGTLGRILDRLQINMGHLLPSPGRWSYDGWRGYQTSERMTGAFGFLDGDLIERFLGLPAELQRLVFTGNDVSGGSSIERLRKNEYWASYSRVDGECNAAVLAQMSVSDIGQQEGVTLEYVLRIVESLTRLH